MKKLIVDIISAVAIALMPYMIIGPFSLRRADILMFADYVIRFIAYSSAILIIAKSLKEYKSTEAK
ncbi:hypothetical protein [Lutispora sp.]|uniref:hypothetical protein n=1 Tax=Lutispora sp. TaxID=2828727 RepID=UPI002B2053A7|nr:hypothetical protein [Lutispora sp.]MEA4960549.1 hypothetical protein [Lutispora sp.]